MAFDNLNASDCTQQRAESQSCHAFSQIWAADSRFDRVSTPGTKSDGAMADDLNRSLNDDIYGQSQHHHHHGHHHHHHFDDNGQVTAQPVDTNVPQNQGGDVTVATPIGDTSGSTVQTPADGNSGNTGNSDTQGGFWAQLSHGMLSDLNFMGFDIPVPNYGAFADSFSQGSNDSQNGSSGFNPLNPFTNNGSSGDNSLPSPPNPSDIAGLMPTLPGMPNPSDVAGMLPTPPNPSDIASMIPNPTDMLKNFPTPAGLPNPRELAGNLPNPTDMLKNFPTPPGLPSPSDMEKVLDPFGFFS
jgi:hypothetical protein